MLRVAIAGYGNLGKGADIAIKKRGDAECAGIFTRRRAEEVQSVTGVPVYNVADLSRFVGKIDVLINCGGSAGDLIKTSTSFLENFNTVDSFDTHAKISEYYEKVNAVAKKRGKVCLYSAGWDPGLFSVMRVLFDCVLPKGETYTFWGKGVSQGHSNAIKRIDGVKYAVAYTIPNNKIIKCVLKGETPKSGIESVHSRECYVVLEKGASEKVVRDKIVDMPYYFFGYKTDVHFISQDEFIKKHCEFFHCGRILRNGKTSNESSVSLGFSLKTASNPELTGEILVSCARAAYRLSKEGKHGAFNLTDIPLKYLSDKSDENLRNTFI